MAKWADTHLPGERFYHTERRRSSWLRRAWGAFVDALAEVLYVVFVGTGLVVVLLLVGIVVLSWAAVAVPAAAR